VAKTLSERISRYAQVVLSTLAYAGTGDVLQIQALLATAGEHAEAEDAAPWKVGWGCCACMHARGLLCMHAWRCLLLSFCSSWSTSPTLVPPHA
jgi:26S proteasome regulatory subunit N1